MCKHPTCEGGICRREKKAKAAPKKIAQYSKKRQAINREYAKKAKAFREANPHCQVNLTGCTGKTECVHHVRGRIGNNLMDETNWLASCLSCNLRAETHSKEAFDKQVKKSKF